MEKDVLFLCQFFYPEYNSSATLPTDTARYLVDAGFSVGAMCGYPKEYVREEKVLKKEIIDGVEIKRINYLQLKRSSKIGRLINYFSFTLSVLFHIFELKKCKCVIVYTNPPVLSVVAIVANLLFKTKIISVSYDVYPEVAYSSGSLSPKGIISRTMQFINRHLCRRVSSVVALTDEMKNFLADNRPDLDKDKIRVISNWAHESKPVMTDNPKQVFNYKPDDFIVLYSGNMGICQDVDTMIDAAEILKDYEKIKFLIVGHGSKMDEVTERVRHLDNVKMHEFLTGDKFESALLASSCGIVSLSKGLKGQCAPSKLYSYLQAGLPVITVVDSDSYLAQEVEAEHIGYSIEIGDKEALADAILALSCDEGLQNEMKQRAEALYNRCYTKSICLDKYVELIKELSGESDE